MAKSALKNILSGSVWGIAAKIFDAVAKFVTIPLLISYYGKSDFGLVALAFSLNTYLRLMDLGLNTSGVRFFAVWFAQDKKDKISNVSQSSVFIYGIIGLINAVVFIVLGYNSDRFFHLNPEQTHVFELMMYILASSTIISWTGYVIDQLLTSIEEFTWISRMTIILSILNFSTAVIAVKFRLSLQTYFLLFVLCSVCILPFNIWRLKKTHIPLKKLLTPKFYPKDFKEVVSYSLALFAMGIFQVTADTIRPILLGSFASKGIEVLADYRIIQTITTFVSSMGGVFLTMLLPLSSKIYATNDTGRKDILIYKGTTIVSAFLSILIAGLILNANYILTIYVGKEYSYLAIWLDIWLISLFINMHTYPVSSLIFSTGKTRPLVLSSVLGCIASVVITIVLAAAFNIGAAVMGFLAFVVINNAFTYLYYIPKVLMLDSKKLFWGSSFSVVVIALIAGVIAIIPEHLLHIKNVHVAMLTKSSLFTIVFLLGCRYYFISPKEMNSIKGYFFK